MPKTGRGKVRIQLELTPLTKQSLIKIAQRMNTNRSEAATWAIENALQNEQANPQRLARIKMKLDQILEWL